MVLVKVWYHHDTQRQEAYAINQAKVKKSPLLQLVTCEAIVNRRGTGASNHEAYASVVKPYPKVHHFFRVAIE